MHYWILLTSWGRRGHIMCATDNTLSPPLPIFKNMSYFPNNGPVPLFFSAAVKKKIPNKFPG